MNEPIKIGLTYEQLLQLIGAQQCDIVALRLRVAELEILTKELADSRQSTTLV